METEPDNIPADIRQDEPYGVFSDGDKAPRDPMTLGNLSCSKPHMWKSYDDAAAAVRAGKAAGICLCTTLNSAIVVLDVDGCFKKNGAIDAGVQRILNALPTNVYVEISSSMTGLHIVFRVNRSKNPSRGVWKYTNIPGCRAVELFEHGHAVNLTGHKTQGSENAAVVSVEQYERLIALLESYQKRSKSVQRTQTHLPCNNKLSDQEIADCIPKKVWDESNGDVSEGDFALLREIAKYTLEPERIRAVALLSPRNRPKWLERRGETDWLGYQIGQVLAHAPQTQFNSPEFAEYECRPDGMYLNSLNRHGEIVPIQLCNFSSRLIGKTLFHRGDGSNVEPIYILECEYDGKKFTVILTADDLATDDWPLRMGSVPTGARLMTTHKVAAHFTAAILETSSETEIKVTHCYGSIGWFKDERGWFFITGSGALREDGLDTTVTAELPQAHARYSLPSPPAGEERIAAVQSSLAMLDFRNESITFPLLALIYGSLCGNARLTLNLCGLSGSGKTETATLALQHYGQGFSSNSPSLTWSATVTAIEAACASAGFVALLVDDLVFNGDDRKTSALVEKADRIFRAVGNGHGRDRCNKDGTPRPPAAIHGSIISTSESMIGIESALARTVQLECSRDDLNHEAFVAAKSAADSGLYASAMSAYIQWLASRLDETRECIRARIAEFEEAEKNFRGQRHARYGKTTGWLIATFELLTRFAHEVGAIDHAEMQRLNDRAARIMSEVIARQAREGASAKPHELFLEALRVAMATGRARIDDREGGQPKIMPMALGWVGEPSNSELIGWLDGEGLYLLPTQAWKVAISTAADRGVGILDVNGLGLSLKNAGLLVVAQDSERLAEKVTIPGRGRPRVWRMKLSDVIESDGKSSPPSF